MIIYRKYGSIVEITETEREPSKVRVSSSRGGRSVYGRRRPDSLRRTQQICVRRVSSALEEFGCPLLVTLTFSGDSSDASFANDSLRRFQVRLRAKYSKAQSLFVPELSPRGRIHFHGLIFGVPLCLGDKRQGRRALSYGSERSERVLARLWGQGFVDCLQTDGSGRLAYYLAKYITKGGQEVLFNAMRLLRISHGFPRELVIRGLLAEELSCRYSDRSPSFECRFQSLFLGEIKKRRYYLT